MARRAECRTPSPRTSRSGWYSDSTTAKKSTKSSGPVSSSSSSSSTTTTTTTTDTITTTTGGFDGDGVSGARPCAERDVNGSLLNERWRRVGVVSLDGAAQSVQLEEGLVCGEQESIPIYFLPADAQRLADKACEVRAEVARRRTTRSHLVTMVNGMPLHASPAQLTDTAPAREAGGPLARKQLLVEGELLYGSQGRVQNPFPEDFSLGLVFGFDDGEKEYKIIGVTRACRAIVVLPAAVVVAGQGGAQGTSPAGQAAAARIR